MAKKCKLTKNGETIYPCSTMDAIVHPTLKVPSSKLIGEINVSNLFPTGGTNGTNKYTLESAIAKIPTDLRVVGIKCSFLSDAGELESWEYKSGTFTNVVNWRECGGKKLAELENNIAGVNYVICDTEANSSIKKVSIPGITSLTTGIRLLVKMINNNTAANGLFNINSKFQGKLFYNGVRVNGDNAWETGEIIDVYYDGTDFYSGNFQGGSGNSGNMILEWNTDIATTRKQIKQANRKSGMQISYLHPDNGWTNEQYIGTSFGDIAWSTDSNWQTIATTADIEYQYLNEIEPLKAQVIGKDGFVKKYVETEFRQGEYYNAPTWLDREYTETSSTGDYNSLKIEVKKGDAAIIAVSGGNAARGYFVVDLNMITKEISDSLINTLQEHAVIGINQDGYLYVNSRKNAGSHFILVRGYSYLNKVEIDELKSYLTDKFGLLDYDVELLKSNIGYTKYSVDDLTDGWLGNFVIGQTWNVNDGMNTWGYKIIEVKYGDRAIIKTNGGANGRAWGVADSEGKFIKFAEASINTLDEPAIVDIEQDGKLVVNFNGINNTTNREKFNVELYRSLDGSLNALSKRIEYLEENVAATKEIIVPLYKNNPYPINNQELKILAIGNSWTEDPTEYLGDIVEKSGIDLSKCCVYLAYIPGGTLQNWYDTIKGNGQSELRKRAGSIEMTSSGRMQSLLAQNWDVITLQQVSSKSNDFSSFDLLPEIISMIRRYCTNQKVCFAWQNVWAYGVNFGGAPYGIDRLKQIWEATKEQAARYGIDIIIPTGTAIQNARGTSLNTNGELTRDGSHLSFGTGRYIAACTWFQTLFSNVFNISILGNTSTHEDVSGEGNTTYEAVPVTDLNRELCQECAFLACMDMYNT